MMDELRNISKEMLNNCVTVEERDKFELINRILQDDKCFQKMKIQTAYKLLSDLGFKTEDIKKIYNDLIFN